MNPFKSIIRLWHDFESMRATLREWLGDDGRAVDPDQAQSRADMCMGCDFNRKAPTDVLSEPIKRHLEIKNKLRMTVAGEENLKTCSICQCMLKIKVHVPYKHIRAYQSEEVREKIRQNFPVCWQLNKDK